jgi:hypothetical protein
MTAKKKAAVPTADEIAADINAAIPSIFDQYETDIVEQEDGRWFRNIGIGVDMKLRRSTARAATNKMQQLQMAYRHKADPKGNLPEKIAEELMLEFLATVVIVDWDGPAFKDRQGKPMPYSVETARLLLKQLPELAKDVIVIASNIENFRVRDRGVVEGN